jgi:hypothetical protein
MAFCESCGSKLGEKSKFCGSCGSARDASSNGSIKSKETPSPVETTFESKCQILHQVWTEKRDEALFADFIKYGDLGIPLAYAIHERIIEATPEAKEFIDDVFDVLVGFSGAGEDTGFEDLQDLLDSGDEDFDSDDFDDD